MTKRQDPFGAISGQTRVANSRARRITINQAWCFGAMVVALGACALPDSVEQGPPSPAISASSSASTRPLAPDHTSPSPDASSTSPSPRDSESVQPAVAPKWQLPPTEGVFDYQLSGVSDQLPGEAPITVVVRDATAQPLAGAYNICYVNGFQTQDDQVELWANHEELILHHATGKRVIDPDWPGEYILDPSTPAQREGIIAILGPVIQGCKTAGFDAVEIDNFDTFTRFDRITQDAAFALAAQYVTIAHEAGLAIAQKNAAEFTHDAHTQLGFDFAIAEGCAVWGECDAYRQVYGPHVLQIEYADELNAHAKAFEQVCSQPDRSPLTVLRDSELRPAHEPNHRYARC